MFVVEVGSVVFTYLLLRDLFTGGHNLLFDAQITLWLWFTVLFANFAQAMAEGRGKAQADALRRLTVETTARRELAGGRYETIAATAPRTGDIVRVEAHEVIPADGD